MATNEANPEAALSAAAGLNSKVEAALKELMSKKGGETSSQVSIETEVVTHGNIVNGTAGCVEDVYLVEKHDWSGRETAPYPAVIPPTEQFPAKFEHRGPLPGGSKGAFVYFADGNGTGDYYPWQWIVAFDRVKNKAFILCGGRGPKPAVDWGRIEAKLDASGSRSESGRAYAEINPQGVFVAVLKRDW